MREKLDIIALNPEQEKILLEKFSGTLSTVTASELREEKAYLESVGIYITKAREVKVYANTKKEMQDKVSMASTMNEKDIFKQNPLIMNSNLMDVNRRIRGCKQIGRPYRKEDGTYEPFLFSEAAYTEHVAAAMESENMAPLTPIVDDELATLEPEVFSEPTMESTSHIDNNVVDINDYLSINDTLGEVEMFDDTTDRVDDISGDPKVVDIKEYMAASEDMEELEAQTTNFAKVREELEGQLAELDALKSDLDLGEVITFDDIEPESYGMGRSA